MGKFRITSPDGKTYDITAPDGASEQDIMNYVQKNAAPQSGANFDATIAGMDAMDISIARSKNDALGAYLREKAKQPKPGESEADTFKRQYGGLPGHARPGRAEGTTRAGLQGASFGFGDEIVAGGTAALDSLVRGDNFSQAYDARLSQERGKLGQFREDSPVAAYGAEIVGAIPTALLPALNILRGGRYLKAAGTGGLQGGLYGYGAGEGGTVNRMKSGAVGTAMGTALGAAGVPIAKGMGNLANRYLANQAAKTVGLSGPQYKILDRALQADDALTGEGAKRLAAAGEDAMLADAGSGAQRLLDTAIVESPPAARMATTAIEGRVQKAGQKMSAVLDDTLGAPQGINSAARGISRKTAAARNDAYQAAYGRPIDYASAAGNAVESAVDRVPGRIMKTAIDKANDRMKADGVKNMQIMARIAEDGSVTFSEKMNVQQLDYVKRMLGDMGAESVDKFGRPTADGLMYSSLARRIRNSLSDAVPEYSTAVKLGGDKLERDAALRMGSELFKESVTREMVRDAAKGMSAHARDEAAKGLRSSIDEALANVKAAMSDTNVDAREAFKIVKDMSSRANKEKLELMFGDNTAKTILRQADEAMKAFELRAGVARNSATAIRQSTAQGVKDVVEGGAFTRLREGEGVTSVKSVIAAILGRSPEAKQRISDEAYMGIVRALTGPRGASARAMLERMQTIQPLIDKSTGRIIDATSAGLPRGAAAAVTMQNALGAR
jgi:hypothetical protein